MEFLQQNEQFEKTVPNKRRKSYNDDYSVPVRQRSQANARERDRTHR